MTLNQGGSLTQPCSGDDYESSLGKVLEGIGPLLPGAADKRPTVGAGWPDHPGLSVDQLAAANPECICWHIGAVWPRRR
jgi:hypothetical protein